MKNPSNLIKNITKFILGFMKRSIVLFDKWMSSSIVYCNDTYLFLNPHLKGSYKRNFIFDNYMNLINSIPEEYSNKNFSYVIDIGAHIGTFIVPFLNNKYTKKGIALEPMKENIKYIKKSLNLNSITERLILLEGAASNEDFCVEIDIGPSSTTSSIQSIGFHTIKKDGINISKRYRKSSSGSISIPGYSYKSIVSNMNSEEKSKYLLKLDAEGAEHLIFNDIIESESSPFTIIGELHPSDNYSIDTIINQIKSNYSYSNFISHPNGCYDFVCSSPKHQ